MPAAITHYLFAKKVEDLLKSKCPHLQLNEDAFVWGTQGPDFLFFHYRPLRKKGTPLRKYGIALHYSHICAIVETMMDYLKRQPPEEQPMLLSYIMGFVCHYALDSEAHPFVHYEQDAFKQSRHWKHHDKLPDGMVHAHLESVLDIIMLRREREQLPGELPLKTLTPKNPQLFDRIAGLYESLLKEMYGCEESREILVQSVRNMRTCMKLLNDSTGYKRAFFRLLENVTKSGPVLTSYIRPQTEEDDWDYANVCEAAWVNPDEEAQTERTDSFFELFDHAAEEAARMIAELSRPDVQSGPLCAILGCRSFETGLVNRDIAEV